jgi:hypothetical protein
MLAIASYAPSDGDGESADDDAQDQDPIPLASDASVEKEAACTVGQLSEEESTALVPLSSSSAHDDAPGVSGRGGLALSYALPPPIDEVAEEARAELEAAVDEGIEMSLCPVVIFDVTPAAANRRSRRLRAN